MASKRSGAAMCPYVGPFDGFHSPSGLILAVRKSPRPDDGAVRRQHSIPCWPSGGAGPGPAPYGTSRWGAYGPTRDRPSIRVGMGVVGRSHTIAVLSGG